MSCCEIEVKTPSSENMKKLQKHFDSVEVVEKEEYRVLILKDRANKSNIDWVVWLEVKIRYGQKSERASKIDEEYLTGACESILDWVELLVDFEKGKNESKQLSLFGDDSEDDFEVEPKSPDSNGNWAKYFKDCARVRRNNLKKQYSFFELCNLTDDWYIYRDLDYRNLLPHGNKEMIEIVKQEILKVGTSADRGSFNDEVNYICKNGALSDIELINRVKHLIHMELVPYVREFYVWVDDSYSANTREKEISHRCWFDGKTINAALHDYRDYPVYDLNDVDFIAWLRNHFNITNIECISDEEVLKKNISHYMNSMLWYKREGYNFEEKINTFSTWKQFKSDILSYLKDNGLSSNNGGGSGYSIDSFRGGYSLDKKGHVEVLQNYRDREAMGRDIESLPRHQNNESQVVVYDLTGDEIYKQAFELFTNKPISLFDFAA